MAGRLSSSHSRVVRLLALWLLVVGAFTQPSATASDLDASIKVDPGHGPPTTETQVRGARFGATEQVVITFDDTDVGMATTQWDVTFSATIKVPPVALPGTHRHGDRPGQQPHSIDFLPRPNELEGLSFRPSKHWL